MDPEKNGLNKKIKADFKKLGARLGKNMKAAAAAIAAFDQATINTLEQHGHIRLELDSEPVDIQRDEVEITAEDVPGLSVASEDGLTVAVDITLDDELVQEGLARELVSRIQALRKDSGLEVTDRIRLQIQRNGGGAFEKAVQVHAGRIVAETLAITPEDELLVNAIEPSFSAPVEIEVEGAGKCLLALAKAVP